MISFFKLLETLEYGHIRNNTILFKKNPKSQVLLHALNKGNSNQAADNIYWETQKNLEVILLLFFKHSKKNYLLLEREEKQSQEINKGRAQLTIMKWNKVQRLKCQTAGITRQEERKKIAFSSKPVPS